LHRLHRRFPRAKVVFFRPLPMTSASEASERLFGRGLQAIYRLENVRTLVTFDSALFDEGPFATRYARLFGRQRHVSGLDDEMPLLFAAEPFPTGTGTLADVRHTCTYAAIADLMFGLVAKLGQFGIEVPKWQTYTPRL